MIGLGAAATLLGIVLRTIARNKISDFVWLLSAEADDVEYYVNMANWANVIIVIGVVVLIVGIVKMLKENKESAEKAKEIGYSIGNRSDSIDSINTKRSLQGNEWRCAYCKSINANYIGTCQCGKTREESNEFDAILKEEAIKKRDAMISKESKAPNEANELKKFKELLDSGLITQEDYEAKKKQILGL